MWESLYLFPWNETDFKPGFPYLSKALAFQLSPWASLRKFVLDHHNTTCFIILSPSLLRRKENTNHFLFSTITTFKTWIVYLIARRKRKFFRWIVRGTDFKDLSENERKKEKLNTNFFLTKERLETVTIVLQCCGDFRWFKTLFRNFFKNKEGVCCHFVWFCGGFCSFLNLQL